MSGSTTGAERAFVLGLDGVPWRFIERWSEDGTLPNFARLREEGASGPLDSTRPPTTPLAWPSIATGVWPDKHGVYGFQKLSSEYTHRMYTSQDITQPRLWHQLSPSIVGNVPLTYPPDELDGSVVGGMMTPSTETDYTHPDSLADEIEDAIPSYRISLEYPEYADDLEAFESAIDDLLADRRALLDLLLDRTPDWRLCFFVFTAPDRFQHLVWDEDRLREHYRKLDSILGDVMAYTDERDANLFVVSDHGFGEIETLVYVNYLLEEAGYLTRRDDEGTRGALSKLGITRDRVTNVLARVGLSEERLATTLPRGIVDSVAESIPGDHALYDVSYPETTAFVHDAGNLYVNDTERFAHGTVDPRDVPGLKSEVTDLFESVTDPVTDEQVLSVFDGDELFPTDDHSPDLVVNGKPGYETRNAIVDEPFGDTGSTAASHERTGIMCCRGPDIESGATLRGARVVDVSPTLLHGLDEPVPASADGRVLFDAFETDSPPATTKVRRRTVNVREHDNSVDDDFSDVETRLKGLGYME
ncbi:type I phosphodiesterase/nucleotide pyrophosphatase [Halovivax asiaticus JCM 14624]|uniref:Type I phosphodiesterase/nucleotide pyrophosphatase n=1 Tax=Halovivax asiaticus JCM 14624 TaxID=1227490 RepID=M0BTJ0_9EURY|nr:alkaline phosphatase family protein [Halovivax asiaticus]ELZ14351.1 type I phosphodiesterase/nucleotide pyrophosphatase [Halovivax asiaticus JCM 14624]